MRVLAIVTACVAAAFGATWWLLTRRLDHAIRRIFDQ